MSFRYLMMRRLTAIRTHAWNALTLGIRQAIWGLSTDRPRIEKRARIAYSNAWFWYDGDERPGPDAEPVERYAYSQRRAWEFVMDELGIEYEDIIEEPVHDTKPRDVE